MKRGKGGLLLLIIGGMELSWRYAWATFLTTAILNRPFPFTEAIGTFALASVLTLFSEGKGWRVVYILGIQIFGWVLATLRMVYVFNSWSSSFLSQIWLTEFFNTPRGPLEWLHLILILFWALLFWIGGVTFARRSTNYSTLCSRFDLGMASFFLLFLTKFLLLLKGGIKVEVPVSQLSLFPFFVFGLLAIGLVRNQSTTTKNFLSGYQGVGVILSFTMAVVLFGAGLVLFFLPYLTLSAEVGHEILKTASKPLGTILVNLLRFIFLHGTFQPESPFPSTPESLGDFGSPAGNHWAGIELLEKILGWVFGSLLGLILLLISGVAVFYLFRWLFSRTSIQRRRQGSWNLIAWWIKRLSKLLFSWSRRFLQRSEGRRRSIQLYEALQKWGRRSGFPHFLSETPAEYGLRLKSRYPALQREIELIIETFNHEVYGEMMLKEEQLAAARFAWNRLRNPLYWPSRLKNLLLQP